MTTLRQAEAKPTEKDQIKGVVVRGSRTGFSQEIVAGPHHMTADEPISAGGTDTGPTPYAGAKGCNVVSTMHNVSTKLTCDFCRSMEANHA